MKRLYWIKILDKKNNVIQEKTIFLDKEWLKEEIKRVKESWYKIKYFDLTNFFSNKDIFEAIIELYLKQLDNEGVNYFEKELVTDILLEIKWINKELVPLYVNFIVNWLDSYFENVDDNVFNNFMNKELFFKVKNSSLKGNVKVQIYKKYNELFKTQKKIQNSIVSIIMWKLFIILGAVWVSYFIWNSLLPKISSILSATSGGWVDSLVDTILFYWPIVSYSTLWFIIFYFFLLLYNKEIWYNLFKFFRPQYKLYTIQNTIKLYMLALLQNTLDINFMKKLLKNVFPFIKNIEWNSFREIYWYLYNNYSDKFEKTELWLLKNEKSNNVRKWTENISKTLDVLLERLQDRLLQFKAILNSTFFIVSAIIVLLWIAPLFIIMSSVMGAISNMKI